VVYFAHDEPQRANAKDGLLAEPGGGREEVSGQMLTVLLNQRREEIAGVWAEMVRRLPDSHYSERPLDELRASTLRAVEAIIEALATGSYTALETYLTDVSLTRLQMGFDIAEVIEALLLSKEAMLPIIWESCSPGSPEEREAILQLDDCLRHMIGRFGRLYAEAMNRSLQMEQRRTTLLLDVAAAANSSLDLDETLITTLDLLVNLIDASRVGVMLRDEASGKLEARLLRPKQVVSPEDLAQITEACEAIAASGQSLYIASDAEKGFYEPGILIPLRVHDRILGVLVIVGSQGGQFNPEQQTLFKSIADQLGVAVENARLYEQAEQAAVTMERSRLARDLHDAVTQTLFSASLIAEVLPKLWERNPEAGKQKLDELRLLTRGALSEMRTLLLELRPATLVEMDLGDLLRHLTNAFTGRTRIPAALTLDGQVDPPPDVKEVFYRVAQEALNNINKHAEATQVSIHLQRGEEQARMEIRDNGRGFDPQAVSPEHLGLGIMCERAEAIGAKIEIHSETGAGTRIELLWKDGQE